MTYLDLLKRLRDKFNRGFIPKDISKIIFDNCVEESNKDENYMRDFNSHFYNIKLDPDVIDFRLVNYSDLGFISFVIEHIGYMDLSHTSRLNDLNDEQIIALFKNNARCLTSIDCIITLLERILNLCNFNSDLNIYLDLIKNKNVAVQSIFRLLKSNKMMDSDDNIIKVFEQLHGYHRVVKTGIIMEFVEVLRRHNKPELILSQPVSLEYLKNNLDWFVDNTYITNILSTYRSNKTFVEEFLNNRYLNDIIYLLDNSLCKQTFSTTKPMIIDTILKCMDNRIDFAVLASKELLSNECIDTIISIFKDENVGIKNYSMYRILQDIFLYLPEYSNYDKSKIFELISGGN